MSNIAHDYIEDYIRSLLPERQGIIKDMEKYASENNVPIIHPEVSQFLKVMIKTKSIKNILEVGTAIGYSACIMADAAGDGCNVTTIERNEEMYNKALNNIQLLGLQDKIKVINGDALEVLNNIDGEFDMIFLDAAKGHYDHFLPQCMEHLVTGGIIVSDNALFRGMVATNSLLIHRKITIVKRMRKYLEHISNMDDLETVIMPLGDGVALSCKTK